jgi:uroporphyrin-III C-methyltransferase/precorrin-2 dehydrogenase/sirohydrochlorin ferrochelatase
MMIPRGFTEWADAARRWRRQVQISGLSFNGRRRFWQVFTALAMKQPNRAPEQSDYDRLVAETAAEAAAAEQGSVTLVGAGPGDPELLTLRAVRALQSADVILYDDLVSPEILEFARREAKKMLVGNTGNRDEINSLIVGLAKAGRRVVRLRGGNPAVDEETAACRKAGVAVEAVPGITTAQRAVAPVSHDGRLAS